jgi:hypothetical protein
MCDRTYAQLQNNPAADIKQTAVAGDRWILLHVDRITVLFVLVYAYSGLNGSWDTPGTGMNFLVHNMVSDRK